MNYTTATTSTIQLLWRRAGGALEVVPREAIHARGRRDYYSFGGVVVAVKEGVMSSAPRVLTYLHGDHLGSVSLTTDANGNVMSQQRYKPYGEVRWASGAGLPTDKQFTSQTRLDEGYVGTLYDYVARAYDPALGRFISADTIVPGAGSRAFNRYAYAEDNPLRWIDPSGHDIVCPNESECYEDGNTPKDPITGEPSFVGTLGPIAGTTNAYDPYGNYAMQARMYSDLFSVPAEFVAAVLNFENQPNKLPGGALTRAVKQMLTPILSRIDPGHDNGLGYSSGIANVKPGTAREIEAYIIDKYQPQTEEYKFVLAMIKWRTDGIEKDPPETAFGVAYAVLNLRMNTDRLYNVVGYHGPIGQKYAGLIVASHNYPSLALLKGDWPEAGRFGIELLVDAATNHKPLPFYEQRGIK